MERTRSTPTSWNNRAFVQQPLDATALCRTPTPGGRARANPQDHNKPQRGAPTLGAAPAAAAAAAASQLQNTAVRPSQLHGPSSRFTIRPPSRLLNGKYTQRERCSPPPNLVSATSSSSFESSSAYGGTHGISGSDSDASMDAEVASLTSGRRLGNGVEGLLRMVDAPSRPRVSQPRIRDAESAVSLFALLTPSPIEHRESRGGGGEGGRQQQGAADDDVPAEQDGVVWGVEPAAKRRRTCSRQVLDT
eukprot:g12265.t1